MQVANRDRSNEPKKGWFKAVFFVVLWLLILSMYRDYGRIRGGYGRKAEVERRLIEVKAKNEALQRDLETVNSPEFKEKMIREKLNMQKNGEVIVVLPDVGNDNEYRTSQEKDVAKDVWLKWLSLIVY